MRRTRAQPRPILLRRSRLPLRVLLEDVFRLLRRSSFDSAGVRRHARSSFPRRLSFVNARPARMMHLGGMNDPLLTRADELQHENDTLRTENRSLLERCERLRAEMRELISKRQTAHPARPALGSPDNSAPTSQDPKSARPFT